MNPAIAAIAVVLTVIGWGGGELFGHGVNRYLNRRYVCRWLEAERNWKRYEERRRREAGKPPPPPSPGRRGPMPKRGVLAESIRNNPSVGRLINGEIEKRRREAFAYPVHGSPSLQAIRGWTDWRTKERCELYRETIAPGRVRLTTYRDGREAESWEESAAGITGWG